MTFLFRVIYPFRTAARSFRSWLQNPADERQSRRQYWLVYTLCFAVLFLLVFSWYLAAGRTFIWYNDGKLQHYTALVYYGEYLREIVKNLLHGGGLSLPEWDFTLGEGADILTTLHYYVIGDPLNLLAVFVPSRYMWMLYDALIAARMYLSGVAFSLFCTETGIKSRSAKLGGRWSMCSATGRSIMRRVIFIS